MNQSLLHSIHSVKFFEFFILVLEFKKMSEVAGEIKTLGQFAGAITGDYDTDDQAESDANSISSKYFRKDLTVKSKAFEKASSFYVAYFAPVLMRDLTREEVFDLLKSRCQGLIVSKELNSSSQPAFDCSTAFHCLLFTKQLVS